MFPNFNFSSDESDSIPTLGFVAFLCTFSNSHLFSEMGQADQHIVFKVWAYPGIYSSIMIFSVVLAILCLTVPTLLGFLMATAQWVDVFREWSMMKPRNCSWVVTGNLDTIILYQLWLGFCVPVYMTLHLSILSSICLFPAELPSFVVKFKASLQL